MADTTGLGGLASRYAVALYDLADQAGTLDGIAGDLRRIKALLADSDELRQLIRSPVLGRADQRKGMLAVLDRMEVAPTTRNFIGVVADNRRLFALPQIIDAFLARLAEKRGEVRAEVTSAKPLSEAQSQAVTESLRRALGAKVVIDQKVDNSLIGGLVVQVGSRLVDHSLKTKLLRLQLAMKGVG